MSETPFPETKTIEVATKRLHPSNLNPRKTIDGKALGELAESIRRHGILQPLLLRVHPKKPKEFEIVCGERRWRASKDAGLEILPATVRTLEDAEALEIMLVENGRREDLDPMEEAETYEALRDRYGYSIEQVAARVGKSKTAVFQRLKLTALVDEVRASLRSGDIEVSVAELIARSVHPKRQKEALERVGPSRWEPAASYREAKTEIEREFMLRLVDAPWSLADADLVPEAGACKVCPKRSGAQRDLFPDVAHKDVCLDSACFESKRKATREKRFDLAREAGETILEGEAAKKVLTRDGVKASSGFVDLSTPVHGSAPKGRKPKLLLTVIGKKDLPPVTLVADPESDATVRVISRADALKALKPKKLKLSDSGSTAVGLSPREKAANEKARAREAASRKALKLKLAGFDLAIERAVEVLERTTSTGKRVTVDGGLLRAIAAEVLDSVWSDAAKATRIRRGVQKGKGYQGEASVLVPMVHRSPGAALGMLLEVLAQRRRPRQYTPVGERRSIDALLAGAGVSEKDAQRDVKRYAAALEKAAKKPAAKKPPAKKKTPRKKTATKARRRTTTAKKAPKKKAPRRK